MIPVALSLGLGTGVLLGLLGAGGALLCVPALVYGAGIPLSVATPISLMVVGMSSLGGAVPRMRSGQVRWRMAALFAVCGAPASVGGAAVGHVLTARVALIGFAAVMIGASVAMLRGNMTSATTASDGKHPRLYIIGASITVGFLTGLFGVGGGFLIIPALVLLTGLDMAAATGTSLVIVALNSATGLAVHLRSAPLAAGAAISFAVPAIAGACIAGQIGIHLPVRRLQRWFAYLTLLIAVGVAIQAILDPHGIH